MSSVDKKKSRYCTIATGGLTVSRTGSMVIVAAPPSAEGAILSRWRVRVGAVVGAGQVLVEWSSTTGSGNSGRLRAPLPGSIAKLNAAQGDKLHTGLPLLEIEACSHPTVMKDMCADCGADLRRDDETLANIASVPMIHSVPELKVSQELAQKIGREDRERLIKDRKLVLLVDLDQTLIHTTNNNIPANVKDVHHFRLKSWAPGGYGGGRWYHTRLRPGTLKFLKAITAYYELHICTFGARAYAHQVAELLDPKGELFSHRILSRDECFDIYTKTPNLKALFPCGDNLVCIIDDREDVWNGVTNLIQVKPYHFFQHTGDINAPPGLEKMERDIEGQGVQFDNIQCQADPKPPSPVISTTEEMPLLETEIKPESNEIKESEEIVNCTENENKLENNDIDSTEKESSIDNTKDIDSTNIADDPVVEKEIIDSTTKENETIVEDKDRHLELPPDSTIIEKDIVKDIEKIVTQVQEKFNTADSTAAQDDSTKVENRDKLDITNECDSTISETNNQLENTGTKCRMTEDGMIDVEDSDDYLLYLEEILIRIHRLFYEVYDTMEAGSVPDLKSVIPQVKGKVLAGTSLVFSGLVPTHQKLEHSRAYMVAQSLGAEVTQDFTDRTTHLVAVRPGTAKVHACRRVSTGNDGTTPYTVTPAWLWCCAERWQHVEEKLFPLRGGTGKYPRRPPPHCGSPPRLPLNHNTNLRKRTPSGRFMDTINPLLSFSSDEIANMDKEVEDIINESDESDSEDRVFSDNGNAGEPRLTDITISYNSQDDILRDDFGNISSESNDSIESLSGGEHPRGWKPERPHKRRRSKSLDEDDSGSTPPKLICDGVLGENENTSEYDECPSVKFRRGEALPSDGPDQNDSDTDGSFEPPDDMDDGEWNMMGAALEREFLGLDDK